MRWVWVAPIATDMRESSLPHSGVDAIDDGVERITCILLNLLVNSPETPAHLD